MILLTKGTIADVVVHTDITKPPSTTYLFDFVNDITNELVEVGVVDSSLYTERYLRFQIAVNTYFLNKDNGYWTYRLNAYNGITEVKTLLTYGKMKLVGEAFDFTEYNGQDDEFITYNI
jgi:hypothetical protein